MQTNLMKILNQKIKKLLEREFVRDTLNITLCNTVSRGLGLIIPFYVASCFGINGSTDAFFFAYGFILFVSGIIGPVVESVIVPYIVEMSPNKKRVGRFVGSVVGLSSIFLFVLAGSVLAVARGALAYLTKFSSSEVSLVLSLLLQTAPLVILLAQTSLLSGVLNSYKIFFVPAAVPALRAIVILCFIGLFKDTLGIHSVAYGYVAGEVVRLATLLGIILKLKLFPLTLSFKIDDNFVSFIRTASFQVLSMTIVGLNPMIDKAMASYLGHGKVSILEYADRLYSVPVTFLTSGLVVTALSHWSSKYNKYGFGKLYADMVGCGKAVAVITLPMMLLLTVFSGTLVNLACGHGKIPRGVLSEVRLVFVCYSLGLFPYILSQMVGRAYILLKWTKPLMQCAFFKVIFNLALNYLLMRSLGLYGIALSTSLLSLLTLLYLMVPLYKMKRELTIKESEVMNPKSVVG